MLPGTNRTPGMTENRPSLPLSTQRAFIENLKEPKKKELNHVNHANLRHLRSISFEESLFCYSDSGGISFLSFRLWSESLL